MKTDSRRNAMLDETYRIAVGMHEAGRWDDAQHLYIGILEIEAEYVPALHMLGVMAYQLGQYDEALCLIGTAAELEPKDGAIRANLGNALMAKGRVEEALATYDAAVSADPNSAAAHYNRGNALNILGRREDALAAFRKAISLDSKHPDALLNLANLLIDSAEFGEAIGCLKRVLERRPKLAMAWNSLGVAHKGRGELEESEHACAKAVELDPGYAPAHANRSSTLVGLGRFEEAVAAGKEAVRLEPQKAGNRCNLGNAYRATGMLMEAETELRQAIELDPGLPAGYNNLGVVLKDSGLVEEACGAFRNAMALDPNYSLAGSNLLYALRFSEGTSQQDFLKEAKSWASNFANAPRIRASQHQDGPINVGFVSADLRAHPVAYFLEPVLAHHDPTKVRITCYSSAPVADDVTARLKRLSDGWRSIQSLSDEDAASLVARDGIDILVDLGGHTANNRLGVLARKPARIQVSWLGFNATTGMEQMDWIVADRFVAPPGDEKYYTEGILRLKNGVYCFQAPELEIALGEPPSSRTGVVTFGCFNSIDRYSTGTLKLWADLLKQIPNSRLVLKTKAFASEGVLMRFRSFFDGQSVAPERIVLESASPRDVLLSKYNDIDIALDPFPCNGATSTVEAVWMGVPFVTLSGDRYVGRIGESLANALGHPEWVAKSHQEYIQIAKALATDTVALASYKISLRDVLVASPICNGREFYRELETVFTKLAREERKKAA